MDAHRGADQLDFSSRSSPSPVIYYANAAFLGIVTAATGPDPCDIYSAALVTAADERLVAAHKDRHLVAICKVAPAPGIGGVARFTESTDIVASPSMDVVASPATIAKPLSMFLLLWSFRNQ